MSDWIPVSEQLPGDHQDCLVWRRGSEILTHFQGEWFDEVDDVHGVTHWMPLPTPPEQDQ